MSSLADNIINYSSFCIDEIKKKKTENFVGDSDKFIKIFLEFVYLFINIADRIAFIILGLKEKEFYIDKLGRDIEVILNDVFKDYLPYLNEDFEIFFFQELNSRMLEYYKYKKIIPEEGESPKETLLWEFAKKISQLIDNSFDIVNMMLVNDLIVYSMKELKIKETIEKNNF